MIIRNEEGSKRLVTTDGRVFRPYDIVRHFKGKYYVVLEIDATHTETLEPLVIYRALYGDLRVYARPLSMFISEVDHVKYPQEKAKYRLTPLATLKEEMGANNLTKLILADQEANNEEYGIVHVEGLSF